MDCAGRAARESEPSLMLFRSPATTALFPEPARLFPGDTTPGRGWLRSMRMRLPRPAHPARTRRARTRWRLTPAARHARCKHRELLRQFDRAAMRARRPLPLTGAHQDFAVPLAPIAMKFKNRHGGNIATIHQKLKSDGGTGFSNNEPRKRIPKGFRLPAQGCRRATP